MRCRVCSDIARNGGCEECSSDRADWRFTTYRCGAKWYTEAMRNSTQEVTTVGPHATPTSSMIFAEIETGKRKR